MPNVASVISKSDKSDVEMLNASLSHRTISIVPAALRRLLHLCCLPFRPMHTEIFFIIAFFPLSPFVAELFFKNFGRRFDVAWFVFFISAAVFVFVLDLIVEVRCPRRFIKIYAWSQSLVSNSETKICKKSHLRLLFGCSMMMWFFHSLFPIFLYSDTDVWSLYLSKHKFVGTNAYFQLCLSSTRFSLPFCNFCFVLFPIRIRIDPSICFLVAIIAATATAVAAVAVAAVAQQQCTYTNTNYTNWIKPTLVQIINNFFPSLARFFFIKIPLSIVCQKFKMLFALVSLCCRKCENVFGVQSNWCCGIRICASLLALISLTFFFYSSRFVFRLPFRVYLQEHAQQKSSV